MSRIPTILAITGPTAVGKTFLTRAISSRRACSVISIDSRQVYKEIDIGSAKPSRQDRKDTPHYLVDDLNLDAQISAGQYQKMVLQANSEVLEQGRMPLWIGGSTLYFHALLFGIANIPEIDPQIRTRIETEYKNAPLQTLEKLRTVDPDLAKTLDESKSHRIIRGLEVYEGTKKTLSSFHAEMPKPQYPFEIKMVLLNRERKELYSRIDDRVEGMLQDGLVEEVQSILTKHKGRTNLPGLNSIGYKEVLDYLNSVTSMEEMIRLIKRNTRRYAKRQITWFKKYQDISLSVNLSELSEDDAVETVLDYIK